MDDESKGIGEKKRLRAFKLWLTLAGALFPSLLTVTQFLPGGTRSFSDWLPALSFLFVVSVVTGFIGFIVIFPLLGHATWHAYRAMS